MTKRNYFLSNLKRSKKMQDVLSWVQANREWIETVSPRVVAREMKKQGVYAETTGMGDIERVLKNYLAYVDTPKTPQDEL